MPRTDLNDLEAFRAVAIERSFTRAAAQLGVSPSALSQTVRGLEARLAGPYAKLLRARARLQGLIVADQVFGLAWSGAMTASRIAGLLKQLPPGRTEIYAHPAASGAFEGAAPGHRYADELAALLDPEVIEAARPLRRSGYAAWG